MGDIGMMAAQAAVNTGSGFLGNIMNRIFAPRDRQNQLEQQEKLNQQTLEMNKNMAQFNYKQQMAMFKDTGYEAQVKQLKDAGLNPALLYGHGGR